MTHSSPTHKGLRVLDVNPRLGDAHDPDDGIVRLQSDDLRSSLASIVGAAELADSGDLPDDKRRLYSGILLREARRLTAVMNNSLALQHLEAGRRELDPAPVDLGSLIKRAVLAAGDDDQRPITVNVPADLPLVMAEAEAILEVVGNFLSNARRFSPDGGEITITARADGGMVELCFEDHGIGIEAEALPRLFHKFYRADRGIGRLTPGAGLGLAMNQRIVEAHGGRVEASSKGPGQGAHFLFTLPISIPGAASGDVLIVEDEAWFANILKAELAAEGLSTVRAADAETAERMLKDMRPRAIILDLALPGLQGEEFLARLRAGGGRRLPVVVLTMKSLKPSEISALEKAGAIAVLPKEAGAPQAAVTLVAEALGPDAVAG